jgi:hypothetical protein
MHEANVCGFLLIEGINPTPKKLAALLGGSEKEVRGLLNELAANSVFSVTGKPMPDDVQALIPSDMPDGVLLSRRMVRDEAKAAKDRANGSSGDNPQITPPVNEGVNPPSNPQRSEGRDQKERTGEAPNGLPPEELPTISVAARAGGLEGLHAHVQTPCHTIFDVRELRRDPRMLALLRCPVMAYAHLFQD